jgi:hypothetical protein
MASDSSEGVEQGLGLHLALADVVHAFEQRVPFESVARRRRNLIVFDRRLGVPCI